MPIFFTKKRLHLQSGAVASLRIRRPACLRVTTGRVWVTIEGGRTDYWLAAGQSLVLPGQGLVVVEAVKQASQVQLCQCGSRWQTRAALLLRRWSERWQQRRGRNKEGHRQTCR